MNEEKTEYVTTETETRPDRKPESTRPAKVPKARSMRVDNCARVNVRDEASSDGEVVDTLDRGTLVKVDPTFKDEKFAKVRYGEDGEGYIMKQFLAEV